MFATAISDLLARWIGSEVSLAGISLADRLAKRHNVSPFKGASTGMRRRADDVTRIDEARFTAHANAPAENLKRQPKERCNGNTGRLPGFRGDSIRSAATFAAFVTICREPGAETGVQFECVFRVESCCQQGTTMPV